MALDGLGCLEEAIDRLSTLFSVEDMDEKNRFSLTISMCNRLLRKKQKELNQKRPPFSEILTMLNELNDYSTLGHEEKGVLYSTYGALYWVAGDGNHAEMYYRMAKKEFLITNSKHLGKIEEALKNIKECTLQ